MLSGIVTAVLLVAVRGGLGLGLEPAPQARFRRGGAPAAG